MAVVRIDFKSDKSELAASNKELEKTIALNGTTQKEVDETTETYKKQEKQLSKTSKGYSGIGAQLQALGNKYSIAGKGAGDLGASLLSSAKGAGTASKAMKVLKIAIASTGIGLLVIALGAVVTFFTKTQKGSDLVDKAFGRIGATVDVLVGRFANLGEGITAIFSGDFSKGAKLLEESFAGVGAEIEGAIDDSDKLVANTQKIRDTEIEVVAATARRSRLIQDQLLISKDMTKSFEEQKEALDKSEKLELANQRDFVRLAQERLTIAEQELAFTPETLRSDEQRLVVAQAYAEVQGALATSASRQRDLTNRQTELENRRLGTAKALKAEQDKAALADQARADKKAEREAEEQNRKLDALAELTAFKLEEEGKLEEAEIIRTDRLLENNKLIANERVLIEEQSASAIRNIKEASSASDTAAAKKGLKTIAGLIQQGLGDSKEAAVFGATISGTEATVGAFKAVVGIPVVGPVLAPIAAAAAGAFALQNINKIANTPTPKFADGGSVGGRLHSSGGTMIEAERGEFVMKRSAVSKYGVGLMDKINGLELNDNIFKGSGNASTVVINDNKELVNAFKNRPTNSVNIDVDGYHVYQQRQNDLTISKQRRYSVS